MNGKQVMVGGLSLLLVGAGLGHLAVQHKRRRMTLL